MAVIDIAAQVARLEAVLGVSGPQLARVLGVHPRSVDRWLDGDIPQRHNGRERLEQLVTLTHALVSLVGEECVQPWLTADNAYLGGLTPKEVLLVGRMDRINAALEALRSGAFV